MKRLIVADFQKCTGCRICEVVCSFFSEHKLNPRKSRIQIIKIEAEGIDIPSFCRHCEEPDCRDACRVEAIYIGGDGLIHLDPQRCTQCGACSIACPFGAILSIKGEYTICDLCGGDVICEKWCPTGAIQVVDENSDRISGRDETDLFIKEKVAFIRKVNWANSGRENAL